MPRALAADLVLAAACIGGRHRVYQLSPIEACPGQRLLEVTAVPGSIVTVYWRTPGDSSARRGVRLGRTTETRRFKVPGAGAPRFIVYQLSGGVARAGVRFSRILSR